jgi:hypothetical protein
LKRFVNAGIRLLALFAGLMLVVVLAACENKTAPLVTSEPIVPTSEANVTDAHRLSDGASKLIAAMKRPTGAFHFTYQGLENLSIDKTQPPEVGAVSLQADISPEEIDLKETRGSVTNTTKAKYGDETNWSMANVATLRVMTSPTLAIAVGASVTSPPSTDLVGTTVADKFTFDTAADLTSSQKLGLNRARMVLSIIKDCKGTAWVAQDSGQLVKFSIDADYLDRNGHVWTEHYAGVVLPK